MKSFIKFWGKIENIMLQTTDINVEQIIEF